MDYQLGTIETRFADIIWEREPVASPELVKICAAELGWKKSTTYTVLRRLCEKGLFVNENGTVRSIVSQKEFHSNESRTFVDNSFKGSLPAFLAAFMNGKEITDEEADEIKKMIDSYRQNK